MKKKKSIRWILFWYKVRHPSEWFDRILNWKDRVTCRLLGHKKPYEKKISCEICPRCRAMMVYTSSQVKFSVRRRGGEG